MSPELTKALSQGGYCLAVKYLEGIHNKDSARAELAELSKKGIIRFSKTVNGKDLIIKNDTYPKPGGGRLNNTPHKTTANSKRRTT